MDDKKIVFITHGRVNVDGSNGITRTVHGLYWMLRNNKRSVEILSFDERVDNNTLFVRSDETEVRLFPNSWSGARDMSLYLEKNRREIQVVHFHLMWMRHKNTVARHCVKLDIPYVITTHAAYTPDRIRTLKKLLAMKLFEGEYIKGASVLHALCQEEKTVLRDLGYKGKIVVIPNGISKREVFLINQSRRESSPYEPATFNLLWIGRIRPDKNLESLINSLRVTGLPLVLNIVGDGSHRYTKSVQYLAKQVCLINPKVRIVFHGSKHSQEKYKYLVNTDIYVQPSYSEGISFSILDAFASGLPMILSRQCNMTYFYNRACFYMTEPDSESIRKAIESLYESKDLRENLKANSKKAFDDCFFWQHLIKDYILLYDIYNK